MTVLESGSGIININSRPYDLGLLEIRAFGESGNDVIIVYAADGYVFSGRKPYTDFTIDGDTPVDRDELIAWGSANFSLCGGLPKLGTTTLSTATAGSGQISVPFSAVTNATAYTAQASSNNFVSIAGSSSGSGSPIVIPGLTNGVAYKVRVRPTASGYTPGDWATSVGTYTPTALPTASAPITPVTNDTLNTFGWTDTGGKTYADAEVSVNGGSSYADANGNPHTGIGNVALAPGQVLVRYKAVAGVSLASAPLANAVGFTVASITGFFVHTDTATPPNEAALMAGTSFTIPTHNGNYTTTIPNIPSKYIHVGEPTTETVKTVTNDTTGDAAINGENAFGSITTQGALRVYSSNYQTGFDNPVTWKIS